jgi:hypothetical protein
MAKAQIYECIEPHCTNLTDESGSSYDVIYRRGDRLPAGHQAVRQAHLFWLPLGHTTLDEQDHRRRHGLHGRA